jgi:hypothetical protein
VAATLTRKAFTPPVEAAPARSVKLTPEGLVTAIVAVTGVTDAVNDLIVPGAFKASLAIRRPKVVDDHEWKNKRGRVLHIEEWMPGDPRLPKKSQNGQDWPAAAGALVATMQYAMDTTAGLEAWKMVKFYADSGEAEFSIGYTVPDAMARKRSDGVRVILMVNLFELSHVLFGANPLTMALEVKSLSMDAGSGGTVTVPALAPTKKVPDDDEETATPPLPADAAWDETNTKKRAPMEAKTAAAVVLEAKSADLPMETKQFSKMKGSYEERSDAIVRAVCDLFSALWSTDAESVWAYPVATYANEVVMNVSSRDNESATYLMPYTMDDGSVDVELGQPEKVTLSLVAEPAGAPDNDDDTGTDDDAVGEVDPDDADDIITQSILAPILAAIGSSKGLEKKAADVVYAAMQAALETKTAEAPATDPAYAADAPTDDNTADGDAPDGDLYHKDNLPTGEWGQYQKTTPVSATPMVGKYAVKTQEGTVNAEDGWMALDNAGHPYPIADQEFDTAYVPHPGDAAPEVDPDAADDAAGEDATDPNDALADDTLLEDQSLPVDPTTKANPADPEDAADGGADEAAEGDTPAQENGRVKIDPADLPGTLRDDTDDETGPNTTAPASDDSTSKKSNPADPDEAGEDPNEEAIETPDTEAAEEAAEDAQDALAARQKMGEKANPDDPKRKEDLGVKANPDDPIRKAELGTKTDPTGEFDGKGDTVTLDPDQHFSMRDQLDSGLDGDLEDRNKNN